MDIVLIEMEVRILGCLIEKEMTTPEYYPLSLNALTNACNQKSNRDPVVSYSEDDVAEGLESLQEKGLARKTQTPGSRVPKYVHTILNRFDLSSQEMAILCELLLRGPQTMGELRSRSDRMSDFADLKGVEDTLQGLMDQDPPLAIKLLRQRGRKESRYMHLLSGVSGSEEKSDEMQAEPAEARAPLQEKVTRLEEEITKLRSDVDDLRRALDEFKSQF